MDKLAHLVSDVFAALGGPPKEYLEPEDLVRAVRQSLAFYDLALSQSNQNQTISRKPFTTAARERALSDVQGTPLWVEVQAGDIWEFVPAVNLASIEEAAARGDARCAFYNERDALKVVLSWLPSETTQLRLVYDADPSPEFTLEDSIRSPASFFPMYSARAQRIAYRTLLANAARHRDNPPSDLQLAVWASADEFARETLRDYDPLWKQHRLASRGGGQRGRNRRPVLARGGRDF